MSPPGRTRVTSLDAARGLAALVVLLSHCLLVFPEFGSHGQAPPFSWYHLLLRDTPLRGFYNGEASVMLFFVLSGLALSLSLQGKTLGNYSAYVIKRLCRIYLPYAAAVLLAAALRAWLSAPYRPDLSEWFNLQWSHEPGSFPAVSYALMLGTHTMLDSSVWSLDYEIRISLLFPFLIAAASWHRWLGPAILILAALVLHALWLVAGLTALAATAFFSAVFLLGHILAMAIPWIERHPRKHLPALLCGLGFLAICVTHDKTVEVLAACMTLSAAIMQGSVADFCNRPVPQFLGRISYSLYLVHVPVLVAMVRLLPASLGAAQAVLLAVPITFITAVVFHFTVERSAQRLGTTLTRQSAKQSFSVDRLSKSLLSGYRGLSL